MDQNTAQHIIRTTQKYIPPQQEPMRSCHPYWYTGHNAISTSDFINACGENMSLREANSLLSTLCEQVCRNSPEQVCIYHLYDEAGHC